MQDVAEDLWPLPLENLIKVSEANARQTFQLLLLILPFQFHHLRHLFVALNLIEFRPFVRIMLQREYGEMIAGIPHTTYIYSFLSRFLQNHVQFFHLEVAVYCQRFFNRYLDIGLILTLLD